MFTLPIGSTPNKENIKEAIDYNEKSRGDLSTLWDYYSGDHPIFRREKAETLSNNQTMVNHASYIVDLNTSYLLGNPVEYKYIVKAGEKQLDLSPVLEQYDKQKIEQVDNETSTMAGAMGYAYQYSYAVGNDVHTKVIDSRNAIIVYDDTMEHGKMWAILYSGVVKDEYMDVTVVDAENIYTYNEKLIRDSLVTRHYFGKVPLIEHWNNANRKSDIADVTTLIDAYNIIQSDRVNDKEQLVQALLVFYGMNPTDEQYQLIKKFRSFSMDKEARAEYLTKQLTETEIEVLAQSIERNIHKISKTPNLSDENFVGNSSGVAIKYKLFVFEQNTLRKERYAEKAFIERFELYNNYLLQNSRGIADFEHWKLDVIFKRNLPQNDLETSQTINNLNGDVSKRTLISQLSFVDDPEAEIEAADKETLKTMNMNAQQFGTDNPANNQPNNQDNNA